MAVVLIASVLAAVLGIHSFASGTALRSTESAYERILSARPDENIFAYGRVSPDGGAIAYATEVRNSLGLQHTLLVYDRRTSGILFKEAGADGYWAPDGARMIFMSQVADSVPVVSIWDRRTGTVTRGVAPFEWGDYFSWGTRDGKDLIFTVQGNYFYLRDSQAVTPKRTIDQCGERPGEEVGNLRALVSKDGELISVFSVAGLTIRHVSSCTSTSFH